MSSRAVNRYDNNAGAIRYSAIVNIYDVKLDNTKLIYIDDKNFHVMVCRDCFNQKNFSHENGICTCENKLRRLGCLCICGIFVKQFHNLRLGEMAKIINSMELSQVRHFLSIFLYFIAPSETGRYERIKKTIEEIPVENASFILTNIYCQLLTDYFDSLARTKHIEDILTKY